MLWWRETHSTVIRGVDYALVEGNTVLLLEEMVLWWSSVMYCY